MKRYPIDQSALYCCGSKRKLFELLQTNRHQVNSLIRDLDGQYSIFTKKKNDGGIRTVHGPSHQLKEIQKNLLKYLRNVERPDWLISGEKGKSILDNVSPHESSGDMIKLDISGFFDNCTREPVFQFFHSTLKQPSDVASICTDLCMLDGAIVQGSPTSMVIAFYANQMMLDELHELALDNGLVFTVYVDDIAFSSPGTFDKDAVLNKARKIVRAYGFRVKDKKVHVYCSGKPKVLTGVVISKENVRRVLNRKRKSILENMSNYRNFSDSYEKKKLRESLLGQIGTAQQIEPSVFVGLRGQLRADQRKSRI